MSIGEQAQNLKLCKKLHDVPSVMTEWQQNTWRPDCDYYNCGACGISTCTSDRMSCPFDGEPLRLLEIAVNSGNAQLPEASRASPCTTPEELSQSRVLAQAVKSRIAQRTGGRIQLLEVEATGDGVVIKGKVSSYYLKQLALEGVLEVVGSDFEPRVRLDVLVLERTSMSVAAAQ
jgi:hypothetical protein